MSSRQQLTERDRRGATLKTSESGRDESEFKYSATDNTGSNKGTSTNQEQTLIGMTLLTQSQPTRRSHPDSAKSESELDSPQICSNLKPEQKVHKFQEPPLFDQDGEKIL